MPEIKLSIGGRDFQVACQEGEENFHRRCKFVKF